MPKSSAAGPLGAAIMLAGCSGGQLDPQGPVASGQRIILFDALGIMLAIVVPTLVGAVAVAWWFRASNPRAKYRPEFTFSGRIEILVWSIPTLVITFLGGLIWVGSHELDPAKPLVSDKKALEVEVVSLDWKWLFLYPGSHVASINEVVVPAGTPVHFSLTSASVMNTFWAPQLAGMIYTMNGMVQQLNLSADKPGNYLGRSGHFSGDGFSDMQFTVRAVPQADYEAWIKAAQADGPTLDRAAYEALERPSMANKPSTYRNVDPELFHGIATQEIPAAPGPQSSDAGVDVHPTTAEK